MKNTILVIIATAVIISGCSKKSSDNNPIPGEAFSNVFGGVTSANSGSFNPVLISNAHYGVALNEQGFMVISGGQPPHYLGIGQFQIIIAEGGEYKVTNGWYYNINITKYGEASVIGTGQMGVYNDVAKSRHFYQLTISSDSAASGIYVDSI